jgi:O-antigen/teichoic acid export membrane protein
MIQTILIARALGITEYGVYGLLFGTIGLVASTAGLQMGLTATVFVARYKQSEQAMAASVIAVVSRFGWLVASIILLVSVPFSSEISEYLLRSPVYRVSVVIGAVFIGLSIVSGIQDGIAQGFEEFEAVAKINAASSIIVLIGILPAAKFFGLMGVLLVILMGCFIKLIVLGRVISGARSFHAIPDRGDGVSFFSLVSNFALPSMLVSLGLGGVTWIGMFMLSRRASGFDGVAIVNTGLQWRGPVLLFLSAVNAVAIPKFSRLHAEGDAAGSASLRKRLVVANFCVAVAVGLLVVLGSGIIMSIYGKEFIGGRLAFNLIILSTIPMVVANVYMQELVGSGLMWRQLLLNIPLFIVMILCFIFLVPWLNVTGYAISLLAGSVVFLLSVLIAEVYFERKRVSPSA